LENEIRVLYCNFIASRLGRERMHRCFEPGTVGVVSLESVTGNGPHSGGHAVRGLMALRVIEGVARPTETLCGQLFAGSATVPTNRL
jgi:hypothetical protein